eukprot:6162539-Amphidinium_carterae.1
MSVCSLDLCECGAERAEELCYEDLSGLRTGFAEIHGATPTTVDHAKLNPKQNRRQGEGEDHQRVSGPWMCIFVRLGTVVQSKLWFQRFREVFSHCCSVLVLVDYTIVFAPPIMSSQIGSTAPSASVSDSGTRLRRKRSHSNVNTGVFSIKALREEAEDCNLDKVAGHLCGKPELLAVVLYLLDSGKLQAQLAKQAPQEPSVANRIS